MTGVDAAEELREAVRAYDVEICSRLGGSTAMAAPAADTARFADIDLFVVLFSNRSGSTLLSDSLYRHGLPIPPQVEILDPELVASVCGAERKAGFNDYFFSTVDGWTRDGHCGFKFGPQQLLWLQQHGFIDAFRSLRVLRMRREDRVAQAVSLYIARETGAWHVGMSEVRSRDVLRYSRAGIDAALADIARMEAWIDAVVALLAPPVLAVDYDALRLHPERTIAEATAFVGWKAAPDPDFVPAVPPLQAQASPLNAVFCERYRGGV